MAINGLTKLLVDFFREIIILQLGTWILIVWAVRLPLIRQLINRQRLRFFARA